jgi:16S rRNA C1402 N4-methylase RsmH
MKHVPVLLHEALHVLGLRVRNRVRNRSDIALRVQEGERCVDATVGLAGELDTTAECEKSEDLIASFVKSCLSLL